MPAESETQLTLTLENGSRIVSLPGNDNIRGYSPQLIIEDEAAFVPDDVHLAAEPMLVHGGRQILMGTPFTKRGHFYEFYEHGGDAWERTKVTAAECPRLTPERLEQLRRNMGAFWYTQEFDVQFLDSETAAFARDDIDRAIKEVDQWHVIPR